MQAQATPDVAMRLIKYVLNVTPVCNDYIAVLRKRIAK